MESALRGSPERISNFKEKFQEGYVRAVASAAGCNVIGNPEIDEGIDISLSHKSEFHQISDVRLDIQMKASSRIIQPDDSFITTRLSRKRFEQLAIPNPTINKIVLIMALPESQEDWVRASQEKLELYHAMYWVNLAGLPHSGSESVMIKAPLTQVFDDVALCGIMTRIGRGGTP